MAKKMDRHTEIRAMLDRLAEMGGQAFKEPEKAGYWEKIGMAIAAVSDDVKGAMVLAGTVAEDWNYHSWARAIDEVIKNYP